MITYLGIEIGGTKLQLGVGPGDGTFTAFRRLTVQPQEGGEGIRKQLVATVPELLQEVKVPVAAIGVGFGGPVDDATRRILKSHQVEGWADFPLAAWLEEQFKLPTVLGNDADAAGLAEATLGAGKGLSPLFYVTVGSGIGGALVLDGKIHRGCGKGAGEIGHLWVDYDLDATLLEPQPPTWNIVEHRASGWAIARAGNVPRTQTIMLRAKNGDAEALAILRRARRRLVIGLTHVIALLSPRRIVIGGGVSLMGEDLFFKPLREELAALVFKPFADCYDVVPAALGEDVVVHGALLLAKTASPS